MSGDSLRDQVRAVLRWALTSAIAAGRLPPAANGAPLPPVEIERPAHPEHGDLATNVALRLARPLRMTPPAIAAILVDELARIGPADAAPIAKAEVAGPGFINLWLADESLERLIARVLADPATWGREPQGPDARRVNVEFVSANPTGPLTVGNARGAFTGDLLCRVLEAAGQRVTREYYFNDSGTQVQKLGASVLAVLAGGLPRRLRGRSRP
jgi:arginyl-tRNA synthetase